MEALVVAGHRTQIITCSSSSSRRRNRRTSSPSSASFPGLPPTRHRHRPRRSPNITNRPSSHRRPLPLEPNRVSRITVTIPARGSTTPASFTAPPKPHAEEKHHQNCSLSSPTRSRGYCCPSVSPISIYASRGSWTVLGNPSTWRELSSTSESSTEGRFLLLSTAVMVVVVLVALVVALVLRCRVGELCGCSRLGRVKEPFQASEEPPFRRRTALFGRRTGNFGRRAAFGGRKRNSGCIHDFSLPQWQHRPPIRLCGDEDEEKTQNSLISSFTGVDVNVDSFPRSSSFLLDSVINLDSPPPQSSSPSPASSETASTPPSELLVLSPSSVIFLSNLCRFSLSRFPGCSCRSICS